MIRQDCGIGMRDERKMMTKGDEMTLTPQADSHAIAGQACPLESSPVSGGSINCHCPLDQIPHSFLGLLQLRLLSVCTQCSGRHCTSYAPKGLLPAPTPGSGGKGLAPGKATLLAFPACPAWNGEEPQRKATPGFLY